MKQVQPDTPKNIGVVLLVGIAAILLAIFSLLAVILAG
jgi:hypothetical protein